MLLAYRQQPSFLPWDKNLAYTIDGPALRRAGTVLGALAALDDRPRPGKEPTITPEASLVVSLSAIRPRSTAIRTSCGRAAFGPSARERGPAAGHECLALWSRARCARSSAKRTSSRTRCATLGTAHAVRAEDGTGSVCLPRGPGPEKAAANRRSGAVGSDRLLRRKPGIQVIATTAPDLPPVPRSATFARDHGTNVTARSACWPRSSAHRSLPRQRSLAAVSSSNPQASLCRLSSISDQ